MDTCSFSDLELVGNDSANNGSRQPLKPLWQKKLAEAVREPAELLSLLDLPRELLPPAIAASQHFPLRVPRDFIALMQPGNPDDPLLRQVLPLGDECEQQEGYRIDAVGDGPALAAPGLLHKYHGRVLLLATGTCAVNCRYCFRRNFPYQDNRPGSSWQQAIDYIASKPDITEVILSGGDPLLLSDRRLADLSDQLSDVPHLKRLRIHSRLPVVLPDRINASLLNILDNSRLQAVIVIHSNHPNELSPAVGKALAQIRQRQITLLNQSVLLTTVNDNVETLAELSQRLFDAGVLPYYLHLPDKVAGTQHFHIDRNRARALFDGLNEALPGYLVPRLVEEIEGQPAKLNL
jgi:EF-P beta-lysylation protein EpmB